MHICCNIGPYLKWLHDFCCFSVFLYLPFRIIIHSSITSSVMKVSSDTLPLLFMSQNYKVLSVIDRILCAIICSVFRFTCMFVSSVPRGVPWFFSSTGRRPASYCHGVLSVMRLSVHSSMRPFVCKLFLQKTSPQKLLTGFLQNFTGMFLR